MGLWCLLGEEKVGALVYGYGVVVMAWAQDCGTVRRRCVDRYIMLLMAKNVDEGIPSVDWCSILRISFHSLALICVSNF